MVPALSAQQLDNFIISSGTTETQLRALLCEFIWRMDIAFDDKTGNRELRLKFPIVISGELYDLITALIEEPAAAALSKPAKKKPSSRKRL